MAVYVERVGMFSRSKTETVKPNLNKEILAPQKGFDWIYKSSIEEHAYPQSWISRYWQREFAIPFEMFMRRMLVVNAESPDKKKSLRMF